MCWFRIAFLLTTDSGRGRAHSAVVQRGESCGFVREASLDATGSIPAGSLACRTHGVTAFSCWLRCESQPRCPSPLPALDWRRSKPGDGLSQGLWSIAVQSHWPSVRFPPPLWKLPRTFCALTRWNVLSYRHCCRGIATVTRSVARDLLNAAWQPGAACSSTAKSKAFAGEAQDDRNRLALSKRHLQSSLKPRPTVDHTEFGG